MVTFELLVFMDEPHPVMAKPSPLSATANRSSSDKRRILKPTKQQRTQANAAPGNIPLILLGEADATAESSPIESDVLTAAPPGVTVAGLNTHT